MDLIETVLQNSAGKRVTLVIMAGGAVCLGKYKDDPRVGAILFVGYPGQSGGQGVADVIFGEYSPSGRLTQTFYSQPFLDEVSFYDMGMRPSETNPGRGYRFYTGENVVYEFGSGLSYTTFEYNWNDVSVNCQDGEKEIRIDASVMVTNTGDKYTASETVLLFLRPPTDAPVGSPLKVLRGFEKVLQSPGQTTAVSFHLNSDDFSLADENGHSRVIRGDWVLSVGPLSKIITV
jgi:beta-D-xylosidase 4